jgi:hypothetical protein
MLFCLRKILAGSVYEDIDALLRQCATGDAESTSILNALISALFHSFQLAFSAGDRVGMATGKPRRIWCRNFMMSSQSSIIQPKAKSLDRRGRIRPH